MYCRLINYSLHAVGFCCLKPLRSGTFFMTAPGHNTLSKSILHTEAWGSLKKKVQISSCCGISWVPRAAPTAQPALPQLGALPCLWPLHPHLCTPPPLLSVGIKWVDQVSWRQLDSESPQLKTAMKQNWLAPCPLWFPSLVWQARSRPKLRLLDSQD